MQRLLRAELLSLRRKGALKIGGGLIGNGGSGGVSVSTTTTTYTSSTSTIQPTLHQYSVHQQSLQPEQLQQPHPQQQQQIIQLEHNNQIFAAYPPLNESNRRCARCNTKLGRITNRGGPCRVCKLRVCKACQEYTIHTTDWVCVVCHKQM